MTTPAENQTQHALAAVLREIEKVYIGKAETIEMLMVALLSGGHVLLEGVPGIAKTTLVKAFATTLGCDFRRIQFTPDLLPADITGTNVLDLSKNTFVLHKGPIFGNVVLGDEINRAPAKTQSALLEAMQEGQVTVDGSSVELPMPFLVLATQNPVEHEGVYRLPEAQLDRFLFRLRLGYPSAEEERRLLSTYNQTLPSPQAVLDTTRIQALKDAVQDIFIEDDLLNYISELVRFTRTHGSVWLGGSPRATLSLMNCAKTRALLHGRTFVVPEDIRALAIHLLSHRLILTPEAELAGVSSESVIQEGLETVPHGPMVEVEAP